MYVLLDKIAGWDSVYNAALTTISKKATKEPSSEWKYRMLKAEHSPIRLLTIEWTWYDLPYWVSVH